MRTEFTQIAITAPLLRRVIAPPRLGVVFIAVLLEDHEQVVDVVLLLVLRVSSVGLLVRLQVEFRVVRVVPRSVVVESEARAEGVSIREELKPLSKKREAHRPKKARGALSMQPDDGVDVEEDEGDGEEFDEDLEME